MEIFQEAARAAIEQSERKEAFRKLHQVAVNENEDVMRRFYRITTNHNKPVLIEAINLDRILSKHGDNGLISISANRSDMPKERNVAKTKELLSDIRKSGYSYLPTYGGYRSPEGVEDSYEPSFLVFNYKGNEPGDFEELRQLAIHWCKKYDQDSVLIKVPDKAPIYVNGNGEKVNSSESNATWKNDPRKPYFTSLKSQEDVDKEINAKLMHSYKIYCHDNNIPLTHKGFEAYREKHLNDVEHIGRRFTYDISFDECYVNPMPCQLSERMSRVNEIMIWE